MFEPKSTHSVEPFWLFSIFTFILFFFVDNDDEVFFPDDNQSTDSNSDITNISAYKSDAKSRPTSSKSRNVQNTTVGVVELVTPGFPSQYYIRLSSNLILEKPHKTTNECFHDI
jgi:hypothetical protein